MDKVLLMIGLAKKAGKAVSGEFLSGKAVKEGDSCLVVIASDISDRSRKDIVDSCNFYKVKYIEYADKTRLGKAVGAKERTVVSVNDKGFAAAVLDKISDEE